MNDQFIQGIIFDWNKIDDDSYLKQIEALKDVERLEFQNS
ncbi:MAG: ABC transporter ATP-binding protein, partial [Anaerobutyricum soehngenii]